MVPLQHLFRLQPRVISLILKKPKLTLLISVTFIRTGSASITVKPADKVDQHFLASLTATLEPIAGVQV